MPPYPKPSKQEKPKKHRKLTKRQQLVRRCDNAVRDYVFTYEKKCFVCGSDKNLQPGHLFSRSKYSVRWSTKNVHTQCRNCNYRHEFDPHPYTLEFINIYGLDEYRYLYERAEKIIKFTLDDLEQIAMTYEESTKAAKYD